MQRDLYGPPRPISRATNGCERSWTARWSEGRLVRTNNLAYDPGGTCRAARGSMGSGSLPATVLPPAAIAAESAALLFGSRFVDVQRPAVQFAAIQTRNCSVRFFAHAHLHESEASGPAGFPIGDEVYPVHRSISFKHGSNRIFGCSEAEVSYKNILH